MAGWDFTTANSYARGTAPVTGFPFTWLVAGKLGTLSGGQNTIALLTQSGVTTDNFQIRTDTADSKLRFTTLVGGSGSSAIVVNALSAGDQFVGIARATNATLREAILNGDLANKGSDTVSKTPASINRLSFGRRDDASDTNQWEGVVYYSALWDVALSDDEVIGLGLHRAWPPAARLKNLKCFWPDFSDRGGTIRDWCGNCHLTINSGAADTTSIRRMGPNILRPPPLKRTQVLRVA